MIAHTVGEFVTPEPFAGPLRVVVGLRWYRSAWRVTGTAYYTKDGQFGSIKWKAGDVNLHSYWHQGYRRKAEALAAAQAIIDKRQV